MFSVSEILGVTNLDRTLIRLHFCVIEKLIRIDCGSYDRDGFGMAIRAGTDHGRRKVQQQLSAGEYRVGKLKTKNSERVCVCVCEEDKELASDNLIHLALIQDNK